MKSFNSLMAVLVVLGFARLTSPSGAWGASATVVLPCTTNMTGFVNKGSINCTAEFMSDPNAAPPALDPPYLQLGKQLGPVTNRLFFSFAPSPALRNTNISSAVLKFNVLDVTNWTLSYPVDLRAFSTLSSDCGTIWTDTADGADYGSALLAAQHGVTSMTLSAAGLSALTAAMNAGRQFQLAMVADNRDLALISGYYSAAPPSVTVTYDCTPGTPGGLMANSLCGAVALSWNPVPGALGYQVFRDSLRVASPVNTSFTDYPGDCATHTYAVVATNGCSAGPTSQIAAHPICAPAPANPVAASQGTDCSGVQLTWNAAAGATSYGVVRDGHLLPWQPGALTSYEDSPGDTSPHSYVVWATNSCGATPSAVATGYQGGRPLAPASLVASHGYSRQCVSLVWSTVTNATGYQVWRNALNNPATAALLTAALGSADSTYNDCSVPLFTTNYYWLKATNACGVSEVSPSDLGWTSAAPATPGVTATYGAYPDQIDVSWNTVAGASVYLVYRNTANTPIGASKLVQTTGATYSDTAMSSCTLYYYWVLATNLSGASPYGAAAQGLAGAVPAPPGGVSASDGAYGGQVAVSWSSVPGATGYEVWRSTNTLSANALRLGTTAATNYDDDSATPCLPYWYWVIATNSCNRSQFGVADSGFANPGAPPRLSASHGSYSDRVSLTWAPAPGATNYQVWRSVSNDPATASALSTNLTGTNYTDTSVSLFVTNYYWVKAATRCGVSDFSVGDGGWASVVPAVPGGLAASFGSSLDHVDLSWQEVQGADTYLVFRNTTPDASSAALVGAAVGTTNYSDSTTASCTPYWYWVAATNLSGTSALSSPARGLAGVVPGVPGAVTALDSGPDNGIQVSWAPVDGATGYSLWRALGSSPADRQLLVPFTTGLNYQDGAVTVCTHYTYWVTATNDCTSSDFSSPADGVVSAPPGEPTNVVASAGVHTRYVQLCWDPVPGATGYVVWSNAVEDSRSAGIVVTTTNACYADDVIAPATTNFFWVQATNPCGQGKLSLPSWGYRATPVEVTLHTVPDGLSLVVDGTNVVCPQTFGWEPAACHSISVPGTEDGPPGTRYRFSGWNGVAITDTLCAWSNATYEADFTTQYYLGVSVAANGGGTATAASGWYDAGTAVQLSAVPESGFTFSGWSGAGAGAYTGSNNPLLVVLTNGLVTEQASFSYTNPCLYSVAPTNVLFTGAGGTGSVTVTADGPCPWQLTNTATWISLLSAPTNCPWAVCPAQSNAVCSCGTGTVVYQVATNDTGYTRFALLEVAGQTLAITQAVDCHFVLRPASTNLGAGAFSGGLTLSAAAGCAWLAVSTNDWLHTSSSGTGPGVVTYTVDANPNTTSRAGLLLAGDQLFALVQAGACYFALNPPATNLDSGLSSGGFQVSATSGCSWTASSSNAWLHPSGAGTGNGTVQYTADANPSGIPRAGSIVVGDQIFSIVQLGACTYTLSSPGEDFWSAAASSLFLVFATPGCPWTAVPSTNWIHTTSTGSGNGSVSFDVDANFSPNPRSGTIQIQDQLFNVTQAGFFVPQGTYNGLFYETDTIRLASSGLLTLSTTRKGAFSGRISMVNGTYAFHGLFGPAGHTNVVVARRGLPALTLDLQVQGDNTLTGTAASADGSWQAPLQADLETYGPRHPCPYTGPYTFMIPGSSGSTNLPGGYSFGTGRVAANGATALAGTLADGVNFTRSTYLSGQIRLPLFVPLYRGAGLLMGWMGFPADASGYQWSQPFWLKPELGKGLYPGGFTQTLDCYVLEYLAPAAQEPLFDFTNAVLEVSGGDLESPLSVPFQVLPNHKLVLPAGSQWQLNLNLANGRFSGSFPGAPWAKATRFQGILFRPAEGGYGAFLGPRQSGAVTLAPAGQ